MIITTVNDTLCNRLSALPYLLSYCCIVPAAKERGGQLKGRVGRRDKGDLMGYWIGPGDFQGGCWQSHC
jgi:hypothetical protein